MKLLYFGSQQTAARVLGFALGFSGLLLICSPVNLQFPSYLPDATVASIISCMVTELPSKPTNTRPLNGASPCPERTWGKQEYKSISGQQVSHGGINCGEEMTARCIKYEAWRRASTIGCRTAFAIHFTSDLLVFDLLRRSKMIPQTASVSRLYHCHCSGTYKALDVDRNLS